MKGEDLYNLYCDVHAETVNRWDSHAGAYVRTPTAVAWHYLNSKEQTIWNNCGTRLGERRVRKTR